MIFIWIILLCLMVIITTLEIQTLYHIRKHFRKLITLDRNKSQTEPQKRQLKKISNMSHLIAAILVCFIATWGPYIIGLILMTVCDSCNVTSYHLQYLVLIVSINSAANIVIYACKSKEFRIAIKRLFCSPRFKVEAVEGNTMTIAGNISQ